MEEVYFKSGLGSVNMIFVILGTQKFQLNRLLRLIDQYIEKGWIQESVFAQIGYSTYLPKHYAYTRFLDKADYDRKIQESDMVITHAGVGSILNAKKSGKPTIVFPRLAKYKEHVDNHQCEVAQEFSKKQYILCCYENDNLYELIEKGRKMKFEQYQAGSNNIVELIQTFLKSLDGE